MATRKMRKVSENLILDTDTAVVYKLVGGVVVSTSLHTKNSLVIANKSEATKLWNELCSMSKEV